MSYYEVPADVLEDGEAMTAWARKALRAALAAPPKRLARKQTLRKRPRAGRSI
jgi:TfoX/Sxy family transcriptional regulator of competence genes